MFIWYQKDEKQFCDITRLDCSYCSKRLPDQWVWMSISKSQHCFKSFLRQTAESHKIGHAIQWRKEETQQFCDITRLDCSHSSGWRPDQWVRSSISISQHCLRSFPWQTAESHKIGHAIHWRKEETQQYLQNKRFGSNQCIAKIEY